MTVQIKDIVLTPSTEARDLHILRVDFKVIIPEGFILIRAGTKTNGLSIPAIVVWLLPIIRFFFPRWHPEYNAAVVAHDGIVGENKSPKALLCKRDEPPRELSWEEATGYTDEVLTSLKCPEKKKKFILFWIKVWGDTKRRIFRSLRKYGFNKAS